MSTSSSTEPATKANVVIAVFIIGCWMTLLATVSMLALGTVVNRLSQQINSRCISAESTVRK